MKILHLTLKKKWFDMILSGKKTDEYREIKPYWTNRLFDFCEMYPIMKPYTHIKFTNGYGKNRPFFIIRLLQIYEVIGKQEWGAPVGRRVYALMLGKVNK